MRLRDAVNLRKDLLFNGAVQLDWFEWDTVQSDKAATHFVFHGPNYHGAQDAPDDTYKLVDTASFTADLFSRILGREQDEPITLAIAGYGTGKSHLALTLATLLSRPDSPESEAILSNLSLADEDLGNRVRSVVGALSGQPYLVVTINGMRDFDLSAEIVRQVLKGLARHDVDASVLADLRPRFRMASSFTKSFFVSLREDFEARFGAQVKMEDILERLSIQDEDCFSLVSTIYTQKMGFPITASGTESLHDFVRVVRETYCGQDKPFAGLQILFDEFGRYLEFAVQKPFVAGSGSLQQLFESVQANSEYVSLVCFIQYELKAYATRVAPELRVDLGRYVNRYDSVPKARLSCNLETLIANLLEKKDIDKVNEAVTQQSSMILQGQMSQWFPEMRNHLVWADPSCFHQVVGVGCWPFHPAAIWLLYRLSASGRSLQQRSAFSLLSEVYGEFAERDIRADFVIRPVAMVTQSLIYEFLSSESYGHERAITHAYLEVLDKYNNELSADEKMILRAILVSRKMGVKVDSRDDHCCFVAMLTGLSEAQVMEAITSLEGEYAVLEWDATLNQFELVGDAIPKRAFLSKISAAVDQVSSDRRADIFASAFGRWMAISEYPTDFGKQNQIYTREWNYRAHFSDIHRLHSQLDFALRTWREARGVDEAKGQLIYCYVGPGSSLQTIADQSRAYLKSLLSVHEVDAHIGAPIGIVFLNDRDGSFGRKLAEYWILNEQENEDIRKHAIFATDRSAALLTEISQQFEALQRDHAMVLGTTSNIKSQRIRLALEQLFDSVYPGRIAFPFDGFHTSRGNAAKDCREFIQALFLGHLDRDWIAGKNPQPRNRAVEVLDKTWRVFGDDGRVRLKPANKSLQAIFDILDDQLTIGDEAEESPVLNLGSVMSCLCDPPIGCNLASAGLALALFIGRRRSELSFLLEHREIRVEEWLQQAFSGSYLDVAVLERTEIARVSQRGLSLWELLLDEWELETTHISQSEYIHKSIDLRKRLPLPAQLFYRYQSLESRARSAKTILDEHEMKFGEGINKVNLGMERQDIGLVSWGASELCQLYADMRLDEDLWTPAQIDEVSKHLTTARIRVQQNFAQWVAQQKPARLEQLGGFRGKMSKIADNLEMLDLSDEASLTRRHVGSVEKHLRFIAEVAATAQDVERLITLNAVTVTTPVSVLSSLLSRANGYLERIAEARTGVAIVRGDLDAADKRLSVFIVACQERLASHQTRLNAVYDAYEFTRPSDIASWRHEVGALIQIYEGQSRDLEDLVLVQKQLDLLDEHYRRLNNLDVTEEEFSDECRRCVEQVYEAFDDDTPPLDTQLIYSRLAESIRCSRDEMAVNWLERNVVSIEIIGTLSAAAAVEMRTRLSRVPRLLSGPQQETVKEALAACENRLDDLEVEGLHAKFLALTEAGKTAFLRLIGKYNSG